MGIIKAFTSSLPNILEEQWLEWFSCDTMPMEVLLLRAHKIVGARSTNTRKDDQVITNGSLVIVNEGQAAIATANGKIIGVCTEPGNHKFYDPNHTGGVGGILKDAFDRFSYGGGDVQPLVHRLYYVNIKECMGNPFATEAPIPVRIKDPSLGLDMDGSLLAEGTYSYRITDPALFYKMLVGNIGGAYTRSQLNRQIKMLVLSSLQGAVYTVTQQGARPFEIAKNTKILSDQVQKDLNNGWIHQHGMEVLSVAISNLQITEGTLIKDAQRTAMLKDPSMASATLSLAKADSLKIAAGNQHNSMVAYLRGQGNKPKPQDSPVWICICGTKNTGRFCTECGKRADGNG